MIPVPAHHALQVDPVPCREVRTISEMLGRIHIVSLPPFVLDAFPFVKGLIHDQEAQFIAQVQKVRIRRIMRCADGIDTAALEDLQAAGPDILRHSRAETARVMVHAHTLELHAHSVQEEPVIRVKAEGPDAHRNAFFIPHFPVLAYLAHQRVQHRNIRAPQAHFASRKLCALLIAGCLCPGNHVPGLVLELEADSLPAQRLPGNVQHGLLRVRFRRAHKDAVGRKACHIGDFQHHMTVNAAAGIPAGIRHVLMLHAHGEHVFARMRKLADIHGK